MTPMTKEISITGTVLTVQTVSLSKISLPFFRLPPPTCENGMSLSLSVCLWNTLKRVRKAEGGLI